MSKQWLVVVTVLAGLAIGVWALMHFGPENGPAEEGTVEGEFREV